MPVWQSIDFKVRSCVAIAASSLLYVKSNKSGHAVKGVNISAESILCEAIFPLARILPALSVLPSPLPSLQPSSRARDASGAVHRRR